MKATAAFGIVYLMAAGCGGGSSGVTLSNLPSARAEAVCAQNYKCCSAADLMNEMDGDGKPLTQQQCVSNIRTAWSLVVSDITEGQKKGRVAYDQPKGEACIAGIKAMSCEDWNDTRKMPAECTEAFVAKVAAGGACLSDFECIDGTCDGADSSATPPKDGTCKAKIAAGAACTFTDTCADLNYCGPADTCVAKKAGGEACTATDECVNNCNTMTNKCTAFVACNAGPVTPRSTLLSLVGLGIVLASVRRRRRA